MYDKALLQGVWPALKLNTQWNTLQETGDPDDLPGGFPTSPSNLFKKEDN